MLAGFEPFLTLSVFIFLKRPPLHNSAEPQSSVWVSMFTVTACLEHLVPPVSWLYLPDAISLKMGFYTTCLVVCEVKHLVSLRSLTQHRHIDYPQTSVGKLICRRGGVHPNRLSHDNWGGTTAVRVMNSATSDRVRLEGSSWSKHRRVHCLLHSGALWTWTGPIPMILPIDEWHSYSNFFD